jgi:phosphatidate cytidylyltransferase
MNKSSQARSDLPKRIVTALLGVSTILGLLIYGGVIGICLFISVISVGMLMEFGNAFYKLPDRKVKKALLALLGFSSSSSVIWGEEGMFEFFVLCFLLLSLFFLARARRYSNEPENFEIHVREYMFSIFGFVYAAVLPLFLILLRLEPAGLEWIVFYLVAVWCTDMGGYFAGKYFGRHKLYASVSPKKTIEGLLGGVILSVLACMFFAEQWLVPALSALPKDLGLDSPRTVTTIQIMGLGAMIAFLSQCGDLMESLLKRAVGVKDFGTLLPGHGGFLDRFDGVIFAAPVMYLCVIYVLT